MKRDAFDELFDRSSDGVSDEGMIERDLFETPDPIGERDVVNDVLSRVDRHRSFLKPSQTRRVTAGRWTLSGLAAIGLIGGLLAYDSLLVGRSMDAEAQSAGIVPVSGEVRRVNTLLRERISGLLEGQETRETDPEIMRRLVEARSAQGSVSPSGTVILVVPGLRADGDVSTNAKGHWDVRPGSGWQASNNP